MIAYSHFLFDDCNLGENMQGNKMNRNVAEELVFYTANNGKWQKYDGDGIKTGSEERGLMKWIKMCYPQLKC